MKKNRIIMKKKIISIMMTAVMIFSMSTAFSFAGDTSSKIIVNSSGDKLIPEDVAEIMAEYFIRDNLLGESVNWTEDTFISNSITMYDQNGNISAYSFELKTDGTANGYIVVSAYADLENHILEYSDSAEPVYKKLSLSSSSDKIVYLGGLEYYKDNGTETLMSVEQNPVSKDNVKNLTSELLLKTNNEKHAEISNGESGISLNMESILKILLLMRISIMEDHFLLMNIEMYLKIIVILLYKKIWQDIHKIVVRAPLLIHY